MSSVIKRAEGGKCAECNIPEGSGEEGCERKYPIPGVFTHQITVSLRLEASYFRLSIEQNLILPQRNWTGPTDSVHRLCSYAKNLKGNLAVLPPPPTHDDGKALWESKLCLTTMVESLRESAAFQICSVWTRKLFRQKR